MAKSMWKDLSITRNLTFLQGTWCCVQGVAKKTVVASSPVFMLDGCLFRKKELPSSNVAPIVGEEFPGPAANSSGDRDIGGTGLPPLAGAALAPKAISSVLPNAERFAIFGVRATWRSGPSWPTK